MSEDLAFSNQRIIPIEIETEMKKCFIDYAMSVIIERALPDVRDGLKPVHRRILYSMFTQGFTPDKSHRKCATTVGDVLGRFHPHGDAAVYESLVRMAQDFSLRHPLIDGHGNFGSRDGDSPAAYRYTESRLDKISLEMLADINKDTVDFKPNFDDHEMEPTVLPSRFPNLLVNGSSGIAVGMATNIPPHNLGEVIDGVIKIIDEPDVDLDGLLQIIKGPDFPTAATILGKQGIRDAYKTGKGRIIIRSETNIEVTKTNRQRIIVSELPYQVNKARLIEKIAELVKEKKIDGISDLNDESDRNDPVRIVIELKRDANANVVLNQLYKHTQLQESFCANMLAIVCSEDKKYEPKTLNLRQMLDYYLEHQKEIISRRTKFDLEKAEAQAHILEGLKIAIENLDEVIQIIRTSKNEADAKEGLMSRFGLSERQTQAIVDMRLGRLTGLERDKIESQYKDITVKIEYFRSVLANEFMVLNIIKEEILVIKNKYSNPRRTKINTDESDIDYEDLIKVEENVITLTHFGYIKRLTSDTYRSQKRGGKGVIGLSTREEDFVESLFITSTHDYLLFVTNLGRVYRLKAYQVPESGRQAKGTAIVNLLQLGPDEKVSAVIPVAEYKEGLYLIMATREGVVKKTDLMQYDNIRKGGIAAITLREGDELIDVKQTDGTKDVILVTRKGISIRFNEDDARPIGRVSQGVRGIQLRKGDEVIGMDVVDEISTLLVVTENGFGKRTELDEYKVQSRGGKGILTYRITDRTGNVAGMKLVNENDDLMLISIDGTIIRMKVDEISILGRATQGVTLMRIGNDNKVVSIAKIAKEDDESDELDESDESNEIMDGLYNSDEDLDSIDKIVDSSGVMEDEVISEEQSNKLLEDTEL